MKRIISLLLVLAMAAGLAACGGGTPAPSSASAPGTTGQPTVAMGRWVEQEVLTVDGMEPCLAYQKEDGTVVAWMVRTDPETYMNTYRRYTAADGLNFTEDTPAYLEQMAEEVVEILPLGDGSVIMHTFTVEGEGEDASYQQGYSYCRDGAEPQPVDLDALVPAGKVILGLTPIGPTGVVVAYSEPDGPEGMQSGSSNRAEGYIYDFATGAKGADVDFTLAKNSVGSTNGTPLANAVNAGDSLLYTVAAPDGGQLCEMGLDGQSKVLLDKCDWLNTYGAGGADQDKNYYMMSDTGISRVVYGGTLQEQVVEDRAFAYAAPELYAAELLAAADGSFYMCARDMGGGAAAVPLYRYYFDETLPSEPESTITVWSLTSSDTVKAAITQFKKSNPETAVDYTVAMEDQPGVTTQDLLTTLVTELLAGKGPDVIICDGFDYGPYVEKGIFADLSDVLSKGDFQENLVDSYFTDAGTFVLPMRWKLPIVFGLPEEVAALKTLDDVQAAIVAAPAQAAGITDQADDFYAAKEPAEQPAMLFPGINRVLDFVLGSGMPAIVTADGVNEENLRRTYEFLQAVGQYYNLQGVPDGGMGGVATAGSGGQPVVIDDTGYSRAMVGNVKFGWTDALSAGMLSDVLCAPLGDILSGNKIGRSDAGAIVRPGLCEGAYTPICLTAVNAASKEADLAKAFVQLMAGAEIQDKIVSEGMAVRASSLQSAVEEAKADNYSDHFKSDIQALLDSAKTPVVVDQTLREKLQAHAQAVVDGTETVDEAVAGTKNDLSIYLAERQ